MINWLECTFAIFDCGNNGSEAYFDNHFIVMLKVGSVYRY